MLGLEAMVKLHTHSNRFCYGCGSNHTQDNGLGNPHWYANKPTNLFLCKNCCCRYISNPITNPKTRRRTISFRGRDIVLSKPVRTGICKICGMKRITNIHHIKYHNDDPLKDTIELCNSCHAKEHRDPITGKFLKRN